MTEFLNKRVRARVKSCPTPHFPFSSSHKPLLYTNELLFASYQFNHIACRVYYSFLVICPLTFIISCYPLLRITLWLSKMLGNCVRPLYCLIRPLFSPFSSKSSIRMVWAHVHFLRKWQGHFFWYLNIISGFNNRGMVFHYTSILDWKANKKY